MRAKEFVKRLGHELSDDGITDVAAMMTYFAIFAIFPMAIFIVTVALLVVPQDTIQQAVEMATRPLPEQVAQMARDQVSRMEQTAQAGFAIGSLLLALWGASRGAAGLMRALNTVFDKEETRPWWKQQLIAIAVTAVVALAIIVALFLLFAGPAVGGALADRFGLGAAFEALWSIGRWVVAPLLVMVIWAALYRWLPNTDVPFKIFTPGAIVGVLLWLGVSYLFGLYLQNFGSYQATYGALAGVIVLLLWLWLSNLMLLLGAEINEVVAEMRADRSGAAAELAKETAGRPARPQPT